MCTKFFGGQNKCIGEFGFVFFCSCEFTSFQTFIGPQWRGELKEKTKMWPSLPECYTKGLGFTKAKH